MHACTPADAQSSSALAEGHVMAEWSMMDREWPPDGSYDPYLYGMDLYYDEKPPPVPGPGYFTPVPPQAVPQAQQYMQSQLQPQLQSQQQKQMQPQHQMLPHMQNILPSQLQSQMESELPELPSELESFIDAQLQLELDRPMDLESLDHLQIELQPNLQTQLQSQMQTQLQSQIQTQMIPQIKNQVHCQMQTQTPMQIELQPQMQTELQPQMQIQLQSSFQPHIPTQLQPQVQNQLQSQLESQLQPQMQNQFQSQMATQFQSQIQAPPKSQIQSQLQPQMKTQFQGPMRTHLQARRQSRPPPPRSPSLATLLSPQPPNPPPLAVPGYTDYTTATVPPLPKGDNPREIRNKAEKQRRDKLNHSISELAATVPPVVAANRKIDKTGVLRLTAHYLRAHQYVFGDSIGQSSREFTSSSALALLNLLKGFLLTTTYRGLVVVVSQNVQQYLGYAELDLLGQNIFNIIHPDDHQVLKDNLMPKSHLLGPNGELLIPDEPDGKKKVAEALASEKRRFVVRFKKHNQRSEPVQYVRCYVEGTLRKSDRACRGYNRCCQVVRRARARGDNPCSSGNDVVFIGVVRPATETFIKERNMEEFRMEYRTRHTVDGEIMECDHRISLVAGYMTQEVSGVNAMNFMHADDVHWVIFALREMYHQHRLVGESCYRLLTKNGQFIYMKTIGQLDVDQNSRAARTFVCTNTVVDEDEGKHLIEMMKKKFIMAINKNEISQHQIAEQLKELFSMSYEVTEDQTLPVEDLEKVVLHLVTNLPSPQSDANHSDSSEDVPAEPPLAIIPPRKERILSAIEKIYSLINNYSTQKVMASDQNSSLQTLITEMDIEPSTSAGLATPHVPDPISRSVPTSPIRTPMHGNLMTSNLANQALRRKMEGFAERSNASTFSPIARRRKAISAPAQESQRLSRTPQNSCEESEADCVQVFNAAVVAAGRLPQIIIHHNGKKDSSIDEPEFSTIYEQTEQDEQSSADTNSNANSEMKRLTEAMEVDNDASSSKKVQPDDPTDEEPGAEETAANETSATPAATDSNSPQVTPALLDDAILSDQMLSTVMGNLETNIDTNFPDLLGADEMFGSMLEYQNQEPNTEQ